MEKIFLKNSDKEKHVGSGKFLLIVVLDENPLYKVRRTSRGGKDVNINMFDSKEMYRKWTGGGHRVHGSNNVSESGHDLGILLGKTYEELWQIYNEGKVVQYANPVIANSEVLYSISLLCKKSKLIVGVYSVFYNMRRAKWKRDGIRENRSIIENMLGTNGFENIEPVALDKWSVGRKTYFLADKNGNRMFIKCSNKRNNPTYGGIDREWRTLHYLHNNSQILKTHLPMVYEKGGAAEWDYLAMEYISAINEEKKYDFEVYCDELMKCLEELKCVKTIHMDLGKRNILFSSKNLFYIIDWEFARVEEYISEDPLFSRECIPKELENLGLMGTPEMGWYDDAYATLIMLKDIEPDFKKDYYKKWKEINSMIGEYYFDFKG